jgi:hypothetical protein
MFSVDMASTERSTRFFLQLIVSIVFIYTTLPSTMLWHMVADLHENEMLQLLMQMVWLISGRCRVSGIAPQSAIHHPLVI